MSLYIFGMTEKHTPMDDVKFTQQLVNLADRVNKKRREEIMHIYSGNTAFTDYIRHSKLNKIFNKGNKSKTMRKIASMPIEVDHFFMKVYGKDYYKEKDFFTKYAPEWLVIDDL
jgi:hypothetical protein